MKRYAKEFFLLFALMSVPHSAMAIAVDGDVSDWFSNSPGAYSSWAPTESVTKWVNHDGIYNTNAWAAQAPQSAINPRYDIEIGAFAAEDDGLYVMLLLSDQNVHEDMAIAVNGSATHQYGVDLSRINTAPNVVQDRNTYAVTQWKTDHDAAGMHWDGLPEWQILSGTFQGTSQFIFTQLGHGDGINTSGVDMDYVLEGFIPWAQLGGRADSVCIGWTEISCQRDALYDGLCGNTEVPEPASALLLGGGLVGLLSRRKVTVKQKRN